MSQGRRRRYTSIMVTPEDRDAVNVLAAQLTVDGPGRFGQAETVRYLLKARAEMAIIIADLLTGRDIADLNDQLKNDTLTGEAS